MFLIKVVESFGILCIDIVHPAGHTNTNNL